MAAFLAPNSRTIPAAAVERLKTVSYARESANESLWSEWRNRMILQTCQSIDIDPLSIEKRGF
jgi:hypothetical protein